MFNQAFVNNSANTNAGDDDVLIDINEEIAAAADIDGLIDLVSEKLMGGDISDTLRTEIAGMLALIPETDAAVRGVKRTEEVEYGRRLQGALPENDVCIDDGISAAS